MYALSGKELEPEGKRSIGCLDVSLRHRFAPCFLLTGRSPEKPNHLPPAGPQVPSWLAHGQGRR